MCVWILRGIRNDMTNRNTGNIIVVDANKINLYYGRK